ncbi:MAG: GntR family transcriptional regulator [Pseudomonadota bacterium]
MGDGDRVSQTERATRAVRALILSGEFPAGARLTEVSLSARLDLSRTPLRQAMERLISEGLLSRIPSGGCQVASFDLDDVNDAIELRGVLEGTVARLAAERGADPALMAEANGVLDAIDAAFSDDGKVDFDAYVPLNAAFHELVARMAGSALIEREVSRISQLPFASPSAFLRGQELVPGFLASLVCAQAQHRAILEAIAAREGARAEALAREHARLARKNFAFLQKAGPHLTTRIPGLSLVKSI